MSIPVKKKYKITGTLNGVQMTFEKIHYKAQWAFRRVRREFPDISLMRAELLE